MPWKPRIRIAEHEDFGIVGSMLHGMNQVVNLLTPLGRNPRDKHGRMKIAQFRGCRIVGGLHDEYHAKGRIVLIENRLDVCTEFGIDPFARTEDHDPRTPVGLWTIGANVPCGSNAVKQAKDSLQDCECGDDVKNNHRVALRVVDDLVFRVI